MEESNEEMQKNILYAVIHYWAHLFHLVVFSY